MNQPAESCQSFDCGGGESPILILFDLDGTLVDSHPHIISTMQQAFIQCELASPAPAAVREVIGLSLSTAVSQLVRGVKGGDSGKVCSTYRKLYIQKQHERVEPLFPGVKATLTRLFNQGYSLGIVTGKSTRGLMRMLEQHDLGKMFLVWRSADVCPSKPHPAMVLECMDEVGVPPGNTVVVGDSCMDVDMAVSSGVSAVGVSYGAQEPERLLARGATIVIDHISELLDLFPPLPGDYMMGRSDGKSHEGSNA